MTYLSQSALAEALYATLTGDSTLMAQINGVFAHVPQSTAFPYLVISAGRVNDWSTATTQGSRHDIALEIYSREAGQKECAEIIERVTSLLHRQAYTVTGHALVQSRVVNSEIRLLADGVTTRGSVQLRVLLETL